MVVGTEIHVSRFKSPPRGGGPGDSAPSAPSTSDQDQDVPHPISPSPAGGRDPAVVHADEIGETREKELNGRDRNNLQMEKLQTTPSSLWSRKLLLLKEDQRLKQDVELF